MICISLTFINGSSNCNHHQPAQPPTMANNAVKMSSLVVIVVVVAVAVDCGVGADDDVGKKSASGMNGTKVKMRLLCVFMSIHK